MGAALACNANAVERRIVVDFILKRVRVVREQVENRHIAKQGSE